MAENSSTRSSPWAEGDHPYRHLPDRNFWRRSIAEPSAEEVDPIGQAPFLITREDRIGTAGSCFAQHISRALSESGFNFLVTETAHPLLPPAMARRHGFGMYSARYGNIYTPRQLLQLHQRAHGQFDPLDRAWSTAEGRLVDPFRPQIQPGGFANERELLLDRRQHFAAVRRLFQEMDVFVFTLGLTECWRSREDGAVFPVCPGVAGGRFDDDRYEFVNLGLREVVEDTKAVVHLIRRTNPRCRLVFTVSPVPLMATMEPRSVLLSTVHSKSVLRVAVEEIVSDIGDAAYFPSYEIITGHFHRGRYFAEDLRTVTPAGVNHCMRLFLAHFTQPTDGPVPSRQEHSAGRENLARHASHRHLGQVEKLVDVWCDEELLDDGT